MFLTRTFELTDGGLEVTHTGGLRRRNYRIPMRFMAGPCLFGSSTPGTMLAMRIFSVIAIMPATYLFLNAIRETNDKMFAMSVTLFLISFIYLFLGFCARTPISFVRFSVGRVKVTIWRTGRDAGDFDEFARRLSAVIGS
jgi:hypothetical protein